MRYIDVYWIHEFDDEPNRLVSEIDKGWMEVRKLEFFKDGGIGFATANAHSENTMLSTSGVPSIDVINTSPEFKARKMSKKEFEYLWQKYGPKIRR